MDTNALTAVDLENILSAAHSLRYAGVGNETLCPVTDLPTNDSSLWYPSLEWGSVRLFEAGVPESQWWESADKFQEALVATQGEKSMSRVRGYPDTPFKKFKADKMRNITRKTIETMVASLGPSTGLYLAGGSVCRALCGRGRDNNWRPPCDFDIFCVGESEEVLAGAISQLREKIIANSEEVLCARSCHCINLRGSVSGVTIQVVLRKYSTFAEVLHGFDLGSASVGFDGKMVYLTPLARISFTHGINLVDLSCRRFSYEKRLLKYMQIGFAVAGECLDVSAHDNYSILRLGCLEGKVARKPAANVVDMQYAQISYSQPGHDGRRESYSGAACYDPESISRRNASAYLRKGSKGFLVPSPADDPWEARPYWGEGGPGVVLKGAWEARIYDPISAGGVPKGAWVDVIGAQAIKDALFANADHSADLSKIVFEAHSARFLDKVGEALVAPISWVGVESGTNLIGPFVLEPMEEKAWYGEAYRDPVPTGKRTKSAHYAT